MGKEPPDLESLNFTAGRHREARSRTPRRKLPSVRGRLLAGWATNHQFVLNFINSRLQ